MNQHLGIGIGISGIAMIPTIICLSAVGAPFWVAMLGGFAICGLGIGATCRLYREAREK